MKLGASIFLLSVLQPLSCLQAPGAPDFEQDVLPVLRQNCFGCHGPDRQKSGYRLDVRDVALRGGDHGTPAIVPHNAQASPLFRYVSGHDAKLRMPPSDSGRPAIKASEVELLRDWINAGPAWPDAWAGKPAKPVVHWSLAPLIRPPVPEPAGHPIDAFIRLKLEGAGLSPSTEADRVTLIRRLSHDLNGMPPTPGEAAEFMADQAAGAYERLVGRLLASPRHGERWARHWLDAIHFADSHGYEHDIGRDNAWRFRDYVIAAFNQDTPWPRFIREQLAADVFFPENPELTPALGFLGAGTFDMSTFGTAPVTFDYLDRDDLVTQTMAAFGQVLV